MRFSADTILRALIDKNCLLLNCWWRLLISGGVYKSAGDNYWSAMLFTNPRCSLQIRVIIYQYCGCQLLIRGRKKNKNTQNRPKKVPKPKFIFARSSR
jgi:hypothetical protein